MRARTFSFVLAAALGIFSQAGLGAQSKGAKTPSRQVYVSAVDRFGAPVGDLSASDFEITEAGIKRNILKAGLAKSPMRIALMIDTGDGATPALNHLRAGLLAFGDTIGPEHELMLVSTGRQVRVRLQPTNDRKKFKDTAGGLFADGGATVLSDGLMEIDDRFMRKAEDRWPTFVIVTTDGTEGSAGANEKKFNDWLRALPGRGVMAHAIAIKYKGGGMPEIIANHVAQTTQGYYGFVNTSNSLPDKLKAIAEQMMRDYQTASSKYEITFESPMPPGSSVVVGVSRPGVKFETSQTRLR